MTVNKNELEIFGKVEGGSDEGQSVYRVQLSGGGLTANILTWGAVLQDLRLANHEPPLVLGFQDFASYRDHSPYCGETVGRFANRIGDAAFEIDGAKYQTDPNFLNKHTLHGGSICTGKRNWQIADLGTSHVYLTLNDPDGFMGFPGECRLTCNITLKENGVLHIAYSARTSKPTPVGLAHHSYFTLDGLGDCRNHLLEIDADHYLPVTDEMIPTGEIKPVDGTAFDFRSAKPIEQDLGHAKIYDHNFCLSDGRRGLRDVCRVYSPQSGVSLTVATTEPGLQFYDGNKLDTSVPGLTGNPYGAYAGMCLETQNWPDAPNQPGFPNSILRPEEELRQVTEYRFVKN